MQYGVCTKEEYDKLSKLWYYLKSFSGKNFEIALKKDNMVFLETKRGFFNYHEAQSAFGNNDLDSYNWIENYFDERLAKEDWESNQLEITYVVTNIGHGKGSLCFAYDYIKRYFPDGRGRKVIPEHIINTIELHDVFKYSYDVLVKLGIAQFRWGYNDALNSTTYYASMSCCINSYINSIIPNNDDRCWSNELSISCTKYFDFFRIFDGLYRTGDFILYNIHMDDEDCIISVLNSVSGIFEKCYVYGWGLGYETHMRDLLNYFDRWFKNKPIKAICVIGDGVSRCRLYKHGDGEVSVVVY